MSENSKLNTVGIVARVFVASILLIGGVYNIYKAFNKDDVSKDTNPMAIINEFVADKNGVEFCVTKVDNQKSVGSDYLEVTTEYNYVVLTIKIVNNSTEAYDVNSLRFLLVNGDTEYEYDSNTVMALDNIMTMDTINPGISKEYIVVYETPITTQDGEFLLKIKSNAYVDDNCVYIALKETK